MNQGNKNTDPNSRFISANAIEEARKEREDAWKRAYDNTEGEQGAPEQEYDPRTLYEQLQEQKRKKTETYEESRRYANQIRKLDTDEVEFLDTVDDEEGKRYTEVRRAEAEQLAKFKDDLAAAHDSSRSRISNNNSGNNSGSNSKQRIAGNARVHKGAAGVGSRKPLFSLQGIVELKKPKTANANKSTEPTKDDDVITTLPAEKSGSKAQEKEEDPLGLLASYGDSDSDTDSVSVNGNVDN